MHQPYFCPWLGYFSKLHYADCFVVLDDVHFRKRHYIDRTKIVDMHGNVSWVGIPVGQHYQEPCRDVMITDTSFVSRLITTIEQSYAKALFFDREKDSTLAIIASAIRSDVSLVDIDCDIIRGLSEHVSISLPPIIYSSKIAQAADPTTRIIEVCASLGASEILVGDGSSGRVHDWARVREAGITVFKQNFSAEHPIYGQARRRRLPFMPGLSILDAIFNVGRFQTRSFITNPNLAPQPFSSEEVR